MCRIKFDSHLKSEKNKCHKHNMLKFFTSILYLKPKVTLQFLSLNIVFLFRFDKNKLSQLVSKTCPNRIQER